MMVIKLDPPRRPSRAQPLKQRRSRPVAAERSQHFRDVQCSVAATVDFLEQRIFLLTRKVELEELHRIVESGSVETAVAVPVEDLEEIAQISVPDGEVLLE